MYDVSDAFLRTLTGSHEIAIEAYVLDSFQTGPDPTAQGTQITVEGGVVELDGTAEIRGTLDLATAETDWPRNASALLGPWGNEVFVRRGIYLGPTDDDIEWVPLGYYRIKTPDQDPTPDGPIRLQGVDRMWLIRRSKLLQPRQYAAGTTLGEIVDDLVLEIYPSATITWDDNSDQTSLARSLIVERERYGTIAQVATAVGKIVEWNREGELEFRTAPEPTQPVWRANEGEDGVLVEPSRQLDTEEAFNAVVAEGEGGDSLNPVRGVAYDDGANSPTRFGGRFGRIPEFISSPAITTASQARTAARNYLRRNLGIPYEVDFTAVPNQALDPWDPVEVEYHDLTGGLHVVETLAIPLVADEAMDATTKEQRLVTIVTE